MTTQSERLESELQAFRTLFSRAEDDERPGDMIKIGKVINDFEKNIRKLKIEEGQLLERKEVMQYIDDLTTCCVSTCQELLADDKELRDRFIDTLNSKLDVLWESMT